MRIAKPGSIARVERVEARAYSIPTRTPEADGTFSWDKTTLVLVNAEAGGVSGIGYSYADVATAKLIEETLATEVLGKDAMDVSACWHAMVRRIRNLGRPGICSMAISAVDNALWDLKARLLRLPLVKLLGQVRERAPAQMEIAAGEYGYDSHYFRRMLEAGAVDVLQADATRCAGITGFLQAAALCEAHGMPLSTHTAPAVHLHACCALPQLRHIEYFYDHVRIEQMFFEGIAPPVNGELLPDLSRPGNGLQLKMAEARKFAA